MSKPVVLIVEDHQDLRKLMRLTLAVGHYEILETDNGEAALELIRSRRPPIVLLDIMLPGGLDGLEVCRRIKSDPELRATRIVLMSARTQESDLEAGCEAEADVYVRKPFSPAILLKIVEEQLVLASAAPNQKST